MALRNPFRRRSCLRLPRPRQIQKNEQGSKQWMPWLPVFPFPPSFIDAKQRGRLLSSNSSKTTSNTVGLYPWTISLFVTGSKGSTPFVVFSRRNANRCTDIL